LAVGCWLLAFGYWLLAFDCHTVGLRFYNFQFGLIMLFKQVLINYFPLKPFDFIKTEIIFHLSDVFGKIFPLNGLGVGLFKISGSLRKLP